MDIKELKHRKKELGYSNKEVARLSGVPLSTVQKIFGGSTRTPRGETLESIERVLYPDKHIEQRLREMDEKLYNAGFDEILMVRDSIGLAYNYDKEYSLSGKKQGEYTIDDYFKLPDDVRMELIDGRLYNLAAPNTEHQYYIGEVFLELRLYAERTGSDCVPLLSPVDVQLDADDRTMVQPDIIAICDKNKFRNGRVYGAPEFVVEILSPSTRGVDLVLKLNKYWTAGVKEYWIIDPQEKKTIVYEFCKGIPPKQYAFSDMIPVGMTDGDFIIDFDRIYKGRERIFG